MKTCTEKQRKELESYFEEHFGISPSVFDGWSWYEGDKGRIFLGPAGVPAVRIAGIGLPACRIGRTIKPSAAILQLLGSHISENALSLTTNDARHYINGESLTVRANEGVAAVFYRSVCLGSGTVRQGMLKPLLPKARRMHVELL